MAYVHQDKDGTSRRSFRLAVEKSGGSDRRRGSRRGWKGEETAAGGLRARSASFCFLDFLSNTPPLCQPTYLPTYLPSSPFLTRLLSHVLSPPRLSFSHPRETRRKHLLTGLKTERLSDADVARPRYALSVVHRETTTTTTAPATTERQ